MVSAHLLHVVNIMILCSPCFTLVWSACDISDEAQEKYEQYIKGNSYNKFSFSSIHNCSILA